MTSISLGIISPTFSNSSSSDSVMYSPSALPSAIALTREPPNAAASSLSNVSTSAEASSNIEPLYGSNTKSIIVSNLLAWMKRLARPGLFSKSELS